MGGLEDLRYNKHYRLKHGMNEFVTEKPHINGIAPMYIGAGDMPKPDYLDSRAFTSILFISTSRKLSLDSTIEMRETICI